MKRVLFFLVTCCMAMGVMAQIQVKSNGTVVFPHKVKIENGSGNIYLPYDTDIRLGCDSTWADAKWGIEYYGGGLNFWKPNNPAGWRDYLLFIKDNGNVGIGRGENNPQAILDVRGYKAYFHVTYTNAGIELVTGHDDPRINSGTTDMVFYRIGDYAGYANIQCKNIHEWSDRNAKTNIMPLGKGSLGKICKLNGYSFNWKDDENGKRDVGLIAQEVEEVFPEIVKTIDSTGGKLLSYTSMIPYLIEAIKEQQEKITELEKIITKKDAYESSELKSTSLFTEEESIESPASLSQNKPNPFSSETRIEMFVPQSVANATLYVYDLQGKQVKSITVTGRGATFETIHGSELQAGLYIYSLVTDGKLVGSKQMVLTE